MEEYLEIRKLPPSHTRNLAEILDYADNWKLLMSRIPEQISKNSFACDANDRRYNVDDIRLIEDAAQKMHKSCSEILLDEWGTSGRVRPTLGHLRYILEKAGLFKAETYVAVQILEKPAPIRPLTGPAAKITTDLETSCDLDELPEDNLAAEIENPNLSLLMSDNESGKIVMNYEENLNFNENAAVPNLSLLNASHKDINVTSSNDTNEQDFTNDQSSSNYSEYTISNTVDSLESSGDQNKVSNPEASTPRFSELIDDLSAQDGINTAISDSADLPQLSELLAPINEAASKLQP